MSVHQQESEPADRPTPTRGTVTSVSRNEEYSFTKPVHDEITLITGWGVAGDVHAGVTVRHRSRVAADPAQPNLRQVHLIHAELHDEVREAGYEVPPGGLGENITTAGLDLLHLPVGTILRFGPPPAGLDRAPAPDSFSPPPAAEGPGAAPAVGSPGAAPASGGFGPASDPAGAAPGGIGRADDPLSAGPADGAAAVVAAATRADLDESVTAAVSALSAHLAAEAEAFGHDDRPAVLITGLRNPCRQINDYRSGLLKRVLVKRPDGSLDRRAGAMAVVVRGGVVRPGAEIHVELPARPHRPLDRV